MALTPHRPTGPLPISDHDDGENALSVFSSLSFEGGFEVLGFTLGMMMMMMNAKPWNCALGTYIDTTFLIPETYYEQEDVM